MLMRFILLLLILFQVTAIWAQAPIQNPTLADVVTMPDKVNIWTYVLKIIMTAITVSGSVLTPFATKYLTMGVLMLIGKAKVVVPEQILVMLSTIIAGTFAGVMGAETSMPMQGDTAALMGAVIGGGSQNMANKGADEMKPDPAAMKPHK